MAYPGANLHLAAAPRDENSDEVEIDVRAVLAMLWRGKWIIGITTLIATILAFLYVSQLEPQFRATSKVMFGLTERNVVDLKDVVVNAAVKEDTLQNEIEVLTSTSLVERVVDQLALGRNPEFNPSLRPDEPSLKDMLADVVSMPVPVTQFLMDIGIISPPPPPPDAAEQARRERLEILTNVRDGLTLVPIRGSKVIDVSFTSANPMTAAAIANEIAKQYIVDQLDSKLEATRAATDWLSQRVEELRVRVQQAEISVEAARAELSLSSGQSLEITKQQLQELNADLASARAETSAAAARYDRLVQVMTEGRDVGSIPEFRESSIIQTYRSQLADLLSREALMSAEVPEGHPARTRLARQISEVESNIATEASQVVEAARTALQAQQDNEKALVAQLREIETKALEQSREEVRIRQLEREAQASRALYENFLARMKETAQQEDLQSADARILSPAEPPLLPMSQSRNRTLALSVILGLMVGTGIVFLLDRLNNTFRSPGQLEALSGENVLGVLPSVGRRMIRHNVIGNFRKNPKSSLAESIRNLRTSILFTNVDKPPRVVMFTSSVPREGKSTTSMLIALTSQQMGKSSVIVDCDLRLPSIARLLDANDDKPGLLSLIEGSASIEEAVFRDPETGLHVLMTKASEPRSNINAADILSSHRFHDLIANLKSRYDLVVLDTPPALIVADARILCSVADAVVFIVRWDKTPRGAVLEALKELKAVKAPIAGVALTLVDENKASKYSYEGYAYYKTRYKDYYVS